MPPRAWVPHCLPDPLPPPLPAPADEPVLSGRPALASLAGRVPAVPSGHPATIPPPSGRPAGTRSSQQPRSEAGAPALGHLGGPLGLSLPNITHCCAGVIGSFVPRLLAPPPSASPGQGRGLVCDLFLLTSFPPSLSLSPSPCGSALLLASMAPHLGHGPPTPSPTWLCCRLRNSVPSTTPSPSTHTGEVHGGRGQVQVLGEEGLGLR